MEVIKKELETMFSLNELDLLSSDIVYSDTRKTLKSGNYYFIGFNPGGKQDQKITLRDAIRKLDRDHNIYLAPYRQNISSGKLEKLQKRFQKLFEVLEIDPHSVFCTNLIFEASRNIAELENISYKFNIFWKAHLKFLEIIKPKVIICNGNGPISSYSYLKSKFENHSNSQEKDFLAGHAKWKIKYCEVINNKNKYILIGLPHLSYYAPCIENSPKRDAIESLKTLIKST